MIKAAGYASKSKHDSLSLIHFEHDEPRDNEVLIDSKETTNVYERLEKGDVRFRFVINMATLKSQIAA
jgi:D-arabinose 1-dehydrogenase-like Zn-dependent alcohol dehydrogenase